MKEKIMYRKNTAVNGLNAVEGFDPLRCVTGTKKEDGYEWKLELRYKKLWFRLKYPKGRIRIRTLRLTEDTAVIEAGIYPDREAGEPLAVFVSKRDRNSTADGRYVQAAQFEAQDRALTDAGFGIQFADICSCDGDRNHGTVIYDTPEKESERTAEASEPAPVLQQEEKPVPAPVKEEEHVPQYTKQTPVEDILKVMTPEEALSYRVDFGTCKGWTLKQVAERRRPSLKWYTTSYTGEDNIVRAAAGMVLGMNETELLGKAG